MPTAYAFFQQLSLLLALVWRKANLSPLLLRFLADVGSLVKRRRGRPRHHFHTPNARRTATI